MLKILKNFLLGTIGVVLIGAGVFFGIPKILKSIPNMVNQAAEKKIEQANNEKPYSLQVATFRNEEDAAISVKRLRNLGLPAYYVPCLLGENNLWYNVHIGSYTNTESAQNLSSNLLAKHPKLEIKIENYSNYVSNFLEYQNEISTNSNLFKKYEVSKSPSTSVPTNFLINLYQFPVDKRYNVTELIIGNSKSYWKLYSYAGFLAKKNYFPTEKFFEEMISSSHSFSYFLCEDKLFNEKIGVLVFEPKNTNYFSIILTNYEEKFGKKVTNVSYKIKNDIVEGSIYEIITPNSNYVYTFVGKNIFSHHIVSFKTFDINLSNLLLLFNNEYRNQELLIYPEVLRGLAVLPENLEYNLEFFDLYKLGWNYARLKNNAWWAVNMVGHWNYESFYNNKYSEDFIKISFFDLITKKKSQKIHNNFTQEKEKYQFQAIAQGIESFSVDFGNLRGWYLGLNDYNELSFSFGSFLVAVNSFSPYKLPYSDIKYISENIIYKNTKNQTNQNEDLVL
ncbi:MAG: SPOR domain-containing protein [Brevinematales bacterium]|nr:SPOR domain-containing protein [Brevinematales bacterium]